MKRTLMFMFLLIGMVGLVIPFASATLNDNIRSYYTFNETGNPLADVVSGLDATGSGTNFLFAQAGIINGSVYGDTGGANSVVDLPTTYGVFTDGEYSVSFWVNSIGGIELKFHGEANTRLIQSGGTMNWEVNGGNTLTAGYDSGTWINYIITSNSTGRKFYKNGVLASSSTLTTPSSSGGSSQFIFNNGDYLDEMGIWDRALTSTEVSALYSNGNGNTYPFSGSISLNSPAEGYISASTSVEFNATAFARSGATLINMTLEHNASGTWTDIETKSLSGAEDTETFTDTFVDGDNFDWRIDACDDVSCFISENRNLIIDTSVPSISIISPINNSLIENIGEINLNQSVEITITDINLDTCWYSYNNINTTFGTGGTCGDFNLTLKDVSTLPIHELIVWANDTGGNIGVNSTQWEYRGFITNQTFNSPVLETSSSTYGIEMVLGTDTSFTSGELFTNGSSQGLGSFTTSGSNITATKIITVPSVTIGSGSEIYEINWNITLADTETGDTISNLSSIQEQTINELVFNFCGASGATVPVLNFTMMDEITNTEINAATNATTFEGTFNLGANSEFLTKNFSFSNQSVDVSRFDFCTSNESNVFFTNLQSDYSAVGFSDKNYFLNNASLNGNATNEIDLFLLREEESIEFFITVLESLSPVQDATIHIAKFFTGEGVYKTVEIDVTDSSGRVSANLELNKPYRFTVIKDSSILGIFEQNSICEAAPCEINLNLDTIPSDYLAGFTSAFAQNVVYNITFDPITKMVDFEFVDLTGLATSFRMDIVDLNNYVNGSSVINTQRVFTSSGSMSYNASLLDAGDYRVNTYIARSPDQFIAFLEFLLEGFGATFGMLGLAFAFMFILIVIFGLSLNPSFIIMSIPLAIHTTKLMGFLSVEPQTIVLLYLLSGATVIIMNR